MVALASGALGIMISIGGSKLLIAYAAQLTSLSGAIRIDGRVLLFGLGVSLLSGLLFGTLPGFIASRTKLVSLTEAGERTVGSESGSRARSVLIAVQITFSFILLMCAALILRSLYNLLSVDPGFKSASTGAIPWVNTWRERFGLGYSGSCARDSRVIEHAIQGKAG